MNTHARSDAEYWRDVLTAGGTTSVPRWTRTPVPGTSVVGATLPAPLVEQLDALAASAGVGVTALVLAAHAKVLAALSGESAVTTGYVTAAHPEPLPCRLTADGTSWRALLLHAAATEQELLAHREFAVGALRDELGLPAAAPEAVFDPTGDAESVRDTAVLRLTVARPGGRTVIGLRYRTDVIDEECATRILGYHLTALRLMAAGPDAEHAGQSLLSHDEIRYQIDGLAGPRRELPGLPCHAVFEERVRARPDAVAAVQDGRRWTYRELNSRANRVAHALLDAGLGREDVVAVVSERTLEWVAGVLGILKAGGAYLPVDPHYPPARVAGMLGRAGCALALTGPGTTAALGGAGDRAPAVRSLPLDRVCAEGGDDSDPGVPVGSGALAYVFFTSGSTGEPKGAMCEHGGLLNHLYAKIDDLGLGEADVVAQTAPQCFDISLWQFLAPLLNGGRTLVIGQDSVLDVRRFLDTLAGGGATVLQVVPSYLEAVLSFLERHPRELPALRCVSVTGEALRKDLVQRWFGVRPGVRLVNAYGLTETSDDTNHAVLDGPPDTDVVPLGRPVGNVRIYLVDEHLAPVPLGAPGAIAFSGICVGRGYINDEERTRAAFLPDPHRPGERLHLGGDFGRWLPDGQLEFLGRRDGQVKVRGFRIEIGEIENALLRVPGVRDAAVVVVEDAGPGRHLTAFCTLAYPMRPDTVRERLADILPAHMVPSDVRRRDSLPLTPNGKTDRARLTALAGRPAATGTRGDDAPSTPTEERLAGVWAAVLGVPRDRVGRRDNFFDRGGTSLSAVSVAVALDREVSLKDLVRHPVLTELAALIDRRTTP
ncbi:amino acid adenylation domain-containing protein [Streptomyces sp. RTGN2]|uniref:non-ribosomal peptide synthetase n=1 Tax=Streptomyces sp. RTGN2 TaxID=3016525 RepID=UPI002552E659|nr:amino acid adenylation domain-containing protein [Streptomyces sp. RTGN2]